MYPFNIVKHDDHSWRFELEGISLIVDDFEVKEERHWLKNPMKAIGFFNVKGNLYGLANQNKNCCTAEELYEMMRGQYNYFQ